MIGQWLGKENHLMLADRQNLALDVSESKGSDCFVRMAARVALLPFKWLIRLIPDNKVLRCCALLFRTPSEEPTSR
jgi:hypothetical protein